MSVHSKKDRRQNNQPQTFRGPNSYNGPPRAYIPGFNGQINQTEPDFLCPQSSMRSGYNGKHNENASNYSRPNNQNSFMVKEPTQYDRQLSFNDSILSSSYCVTGNNYSNCSSTFNDGDYVEPRRAFGQTAP